MVPLKAGRGAERWMRVACLAEECASASASTRLFAADSTVSLTSTSLHEVGESVESVWVTGSRLLV